jgi:hypothetical protein
MALSVKLAEQRLGLSKVACVKTFGEPIVDRGEKVTCRLPFSLIAQEPRQAHGRAQFPRLCLLCARKAQGMLEIRLRFRHVPLRRLERDFTGNAMRLASHHLSLVACIAVIASSMQRQASVELARIGVGDANMNSCSGVNIVEPADRHKSIPDVTISTAFVASP